MTEKKELTTYSLDKPQQALDMAKILTEFIVERNLSTQIQGKQYINVEGWQFAGMLLGLRPLITELTDMSYEKEIVQNTYNQTEKKYEKRTTKISVMKYKAVVEVRSLKDDKVISIGIAYCTNLEPGKTNFQEYAIASMAQTRAIGKAYRNLLGFIVKAAGFEATPAEEMDFKNENETKNTDPNYIPFK